jgi:hypothetical protein
VGSRLVDTFVLLLFASVYFPFPLSVRLPPYAHARFKMPYRRRPRTAKPLMTPSTEDLSDLGERSASVDMNEAWSLAQP